jgi:hypothetical protein
MILPPSLCFGQNITLRCVGEYVHTTNALDPLGLALASLKNIDNFQTFYVMDLSSPCFGLYGGFLAQFGIACVSKVLVHFSSKPT